MVQYTTKYILEDYDKLHVIESAIRDKVKNLFISGWYDEDGKLGEIIANIGFDGIKNNGFELIDVKVDEYDNVSLTYISDDDITFTESLSDTSLDFLETLAKHIGKELSNE